MSHICEICYKKYGIFAVIKSNEEIFFACEECFKQYVSNLKEAE